MFKIKKYKFIYILILSHNKIYNNFNYHYFNVWLFNESLDIIYFNTIRYMYKIKKS